MKNQYRLPGNPHCPDCGKLLNGASMLPDTDRPEPDKAVSVCLYCGAMLDYTRDAVGNPVFRILTPSEFKRLDPRTQQGLQRIQRGTEAFRLRRRRS